MKLSEELKKQIIEEMKKHFPILPKDTDLCEEKYEVTGLCIKHTEVLFIQIEEEDL